MRKLVLAALIAAALLVAASPAGAAVPRWQPNDVLTCDGGTVKVWASHRHLAAKNTCKAQWLVISSTPWENGGSKTSYWNVAPGAHFNWSRKYIDRYNTEGWPSLAWAVSSSGPKVCGVTWSSEVILRGSHGRPVEAPPCPSDR